MIIAVFLSLFAVIAVAFVLFALILTTSFAEPFLVLEGLELQL